MEADGMFCIMRTAGGDYSSSQKLAEIIHLDSGEKVELAHLDCAWGVTLPTMLKRKKDASVFSGSLTLSPCSAVSALPVMSISTNITGVCSFAASLPHRFISATLMAVPAIMTLTSRG